MLDTLLLFLYAPFGALGTFIHDYKDEITAASTFIIGIFTITLWLTSRKQWQEMKRGTEASAQSERAVMYSIIDKNTIEVVMRGSIMFDNSPSMGDGSVPKCIIGYRFKNYGKTPAIVKEISASVVCAPTLPDNPNYVPVDIILRSQAISPGNDTDEFQCTSIEHFKKRETDAVLRGQNSIWFYGRVVYDDIFGNEHEHRWLWRYHGGTKGFRPDFDSDTYNKNT